MRELYEIDSDPMADWDDNTLFVEDRDYNPQGILRRVDGPVYRKMTEDEVADTYGTNRLYLVDRDGTFLWPLVEVGEEQE